MMKGNDMTGCSVEGCARAFYGRGFCQLHYIRWRRHGTAEKQPRKVRGKCSVEGCENQLDTKGLCVKHYTKLLRHGDPLKGRDCPQGLTPSERFWLKVDRSDECWVWKACLTTAGYGQFVVGRKHWKAHRFAYAEAHGELPPTVELDHICFNRACVNPSHLRPVSRKQNAEHLQGALRSNQSSGVRGVYASGSRWVAQLKHNGKAVRLGRFDSIEEAEAAVREGRRRLFTHDDYVMAVAA